MIFKDRLVTEDEKTRYNVISSNFLKGNNNSEGMYFTSKLRGDGVYMEEVDQLDWYQSTQKFINQCCKLFKITVICFSDER